MERLAYWLCAGLASLGTSGASAAVETMEEGQAHGTTHLPTTSDVGGETRIRYPLQVDHWQAVGEHLFEEREYGMSVRYAHGRDRDRWIDVYVYPAGGLLADGFAAAALQEADLIREAHALAGYEDCDIGPLRDFSFPASSSSHGGMVEGLALDLAYAVDGTRYSSAMTLLLERQYFVKARFSIERRTLSREAAREQLLAFTARLQPGLAILDGDGIRRPGTTSRLPEPAIPGVREIRLEYPAVSRVSESRRAREEADLG